MKKIGDVTCLRQSEIDSSHRRKLRNLSFIDGNLRPILAYPTPLDKIYEIVEGDTILCWGALNLIEDPDGDGGEWEWNLYTRASHRKRGLATKLTSAMLRDNRYITRIMTYEHSPEALGFYNKAKRRTHRLV